MKKMFFFSAVLCVMGLIGCNNNQKRSPSMNEAQAVEWRQQEPFMNDAQAEEWRQQEYPDEIAVESSFTPTVEIESIENMSLEDLVIQNCFPKTFREFQEENANFTMDDYNKYIDNYFLNARLHNTVGIGQMINLIYVPANSNLAKAYCLQAPYRFKEFNRTYCNNVYNKHDAERRREKEQKAQENWGKYLE